MLCFKNKSGEIKLGVYNLLNKSNLFQQSSVNGVFTSTSSSTNGRYVMLSFIYNFRRFKK